METKVSRRGQTVIPALIRKRDGIEEGDRLVWLDDGMSIRAVPVPANAIAELRGRARCESLLELLLASRAEGRGDA